MDSDSFSAVKFVVIVVFFFCQNLEEMGEFLSTNSPPKANPHHRLVEAFWNSRGLVTSWGYEIKSLSSNDLINIDLFEKENH